MIDPETQKFLTEAPADRERQYQQLFADYEAAYQRVQTDDAASWDDVDEAETAIDESILAVDKKRGFEVTISTGGPGEWLECTVDEDGDLTGVQFCVAWWSPVQRSTVNEGDALWRAAERFNPYQYDNH